LPDWWVNLNEGQGSILAAFVTVIGAAIGIFIGAKLFGGKVKDLESATQQTELLLKAHRERVETDLAELSSTLAEVLATSKQVKDTVEEPRQAEGGAEEDPEWRRWYDMRSAWRALRDEIERRAATPTIDGRTRARYARIDRRQFEELIRQLAEDGRLAPHTDTFRDAFRLWQAYKNGRRNPAAAEVQRMTQFRLRVADHAGAAA
jgi:hypothetical protein